MLHTDSYAECPNCQLLYVYSFSTRFDVDVQVFLFGRYTQ